MHLSSVSKDTLRGDETEVNHHGRSAAVGGKENTITPLEAEMKKPPSYNNLVSVREDVQVKREIDKPKAKVQSKSQIPGLGLSLKSYGPPCI